MKDFTCLCGCNIHFLHGHLADSLSSPECGLLREACQFNSTVILFCCHVRDPGSCPASFVTLCNPSVPSAHHASRWPRSLTHAWPRFLSQVCPKSQDQYLRYNVLRTSCASTHTTQVQKSGRKSFLSAQVLGSATLPCNAQVSLESVAVTFSALPLREAIRDSKHLSGVKHQVMVIISQYQNPSDSPTP